MGRYEFIFGRFGPLGKHVGTILSVPARMQLGADQGSAVQNEEPPGGNRRGSFFHWLIVALCAGEMAYVSFQVFWVLAPDGRVGPLGMLAAVILPEQLLARRLCAIEGWISFGVLVLYLGLTRPEWFRR